MNVTELVRRLKMTKEEFFPLAQELGFDIGVRAIKVNDDVAEKLIRAIQQKKSSAKGPKSWFGEAKAPVAQQAAITSEDRILVIPDNVTVRQFAEKLNRSVTDVIAVLMRNGIMATINESLDFDTATLLAEDFGYRTQKEVKNEQDEQDKTSALLSKLLEEQTGETHTPRPPVVVVMGHVDHGKTKLLDAIRQTHVVDEEAGGITQHIGAYQAEHQGKRITFIDTPGHEAFSAMRSRGARVADLAILVIAADDGIKPQTEEAIAIMEQAKLPFIVAINKIDKDGADIERVKKMLSEFNLIPEDWGGKTICVPVSAKTLKGIDALLEMILLLSDIEKEKIFANPEGEAVGTIVESNIDKGKGPVATVLVQTGTLRVGDWVIVGNVVGKIKALTDWNGHPMEKVEPSQPARILGLKHVPVVGDILHATQDKKLIKQKTKERHRIISKKDVVQTEAEQKKKQLNLVLRADTFGSLEAIVESLQKIEHDEVAVNVISQHFGNITEKDIVQAEAADALVFGFNVGLTPGAEQASHNSSVTIKTFSIIYELLNEVKKQMSGLLDPEVIFHPTGKLKILALFKGTTAHQIAGGKVFDGFIELHTPTKVYRDGKFVGEAYIVQLQSEKKNVSKVSNGTECGMKLETTLPLQVGDELTAFSKEQKSRTVEA